MRCEPRNRERDRGWTGVGVGVGWGGVGGGYRAPRLARVCWTGPSLARLGAGGCEVERGGRW